MQNVTIEQHDLKGWVQKRGFSVEDFAEAVMVSPQAVYWWFRGGKVTQRRRPHICKVLVVKEDQVLWPE